MCVPLNHFAADVASLLKHRIIVVVCSTTGNGDPPDNAARFYRRFRKRTLPASQRKRG